MYPMDDWDPDRMMDGSYGGGMMDGASWMMPILGLLVLALVVTVALVAYQAFGAHGTASGPTVAPGTTAATELLDLRLARGEITAEDYRTVRPLLDP